MATKNDFNFGKCSKNTQAQNIILEDEKSTGKFHGLNPDKKKFLKVKVDKCLQIANKKCDWLLIELKDDIANYIEIKSKFNKNVVEEAIEQISNTVSTIANPSNEYLNKTYKFKHKTGFIIFNNIAPIFSPLQQNKQVEIGNKFKLVLRNSEPFNI